MLFQGGKIIEEKRIHVLSCAEMKGLLRSFHLQKKVAHIFSAKSCAYFDSTAFSYRLPLVPLRWGNLKPVTRLFFMIGIIR